jgi:hypothetical protein
MLQGLPEPGAALSPVELCYELQMVEAADEGLLDQILRRVWLTR